MPPIPWGDIATLYGYMKKRQIDEKGDSFWPQMLWDLREVLRLSCKYSSRESYIHVAFFSPLHRARLLLCLHLLFIMIQTVVWLNWLVAIQYGEPYWVDGYGQCCTDYNFDMSLLHVGFCIDPRLWADHKGKNERLPIKCSLVLLLKRELPGLPWWYSG